MGDILSSVHASSVYDNEDDDYDENGMWFRYVYVSGVNMFHIKY